MEILIRKRPKNEFGVILNISNQKMHNHNNTLTQRWSKTNYLFTTVKQHQLPIITFRGIQLLMLDSRVGSLYGNQRTKKKKNRVVLHGNNIISKLVNDRTWWDITAMNG